MTRWRQSVPAGSSVSGPWRICGYQSVRQGIGIARRWALTYSAMGAVWPPLAFLSLPFTWLVMLAVVAGAAPRLIQCGPAAADVPNPARPVQRRRESWPLFVLAPAAIVLWLALPIVLLALWPGPVFRGVVYITLAVFVAAMALSAADWMLPATAGWLRYRRRFAAWKAKVETDTGQPAVVGAMFGAWPRGTGAGTALLTYLLQENRPAGQAIVALARTQRASANYRSLGATVSPTDWRLVAWLPR